jgi:hypothetical protein
MAGSAVSEPSAAMVLAQHDVYPLPQLGQLRQVCLAIQAYSGRGGKPDAARVTRDVDALV